MVDPSIDRLLNPTSNHNGPGRRLKGVSRLAVHAVGAHLRSDSERTPTEIEN